MLTVRGIIIFLPSRASNTRTFHAAVWSLFCLRHFLLAHPSQQGSRATRLFFISPSETDRHQQRASACSCSLKRLTRQPSTFIHPHTHTFVTSLTFLGLVSSPPPFMFFVSNNQPLDNIPARVRQS